MKHYFKNEIKRALFSENALISFLIALVALIIPLLVFINFPHYGIKDSKLHYDAIDVFTRIRSTSPAAFLVVIFPLLATIIFSDSYLLEKETGFTKFIYSRMPIKKYVWIKFVVNALSSTLVGSAASFIMLMFLIYTYGIGGGIPNIVTVGGPFSNLFYSNKLGYGLILVLITGICYMVLATLAIGLSAWIKNRYLVLIIPFFYYILCGTMVEILGINRVFNFNLAQIYGLNSIVSTSHVFIYPILLLLLGLVLFYTGVIVKNEKDL